jgi:hypothetical protein
LNSYTSPRNFGCRVTEFAYRGYEALALQNESLRITVLPGKGSDIIEFLYKPLDVDFMWLSYSGLPPASACRPDVVGSNGAFLDYYPGGWQEILPNFGEACTYKQAALGLHGEVSLLPWQYTILQDDIECVSIRLSVRCIRTPFRLEKTLTLGSGPVLKIEERLINDGQEEMDCIWGHHPALGGSFLDESCTIHVPPCQVKTPEDYVSPNCRLEKAQDCAWPRVRGRKGETVDLSRIPSRASKAHDMAYLYGFEEGWYAVTSGSKRIGLGMAWDRSVFKYLWFWQVYGGWAGYPWYGMSYNIGLEPCTSFPPSLTKAVEHGTQLLLKPGQALQTKMCAVVFRDVDIIRSITLDGAVLPG